MLNGRAEEEYQDPQAFFARTFITDGLADLIRIAARRLSGQGGEPVVELQTSFGGGKTHSLIALYHLASEIPSHHLAGVDELLAQENLTIPRNISRAAFIGQSFSASDPPPKPDGTQVRTLWGEIAWQLGVQRATPLWPRTTATPPTPAQGWWNSSSDSDPHWF